MLFVFSGNKTYYYSGIQCRNNRHVCTYIACMVTVSTFGCLLVPPVVDVSESYVSPDAS